MTSSDELRTTQRLRPMKMEKLCLVNTVKSGARELYEHFSMLLTKIFERQARSAAVDLESVSHYWPASGPRRIVVLFAAHAISHRFVDEDGSQCSEGDKGYENAGVRQRIEEDTARSIHGVRA